MTNITNNSSTGPHPTARNASIPQQSMGPAALSMTIMTSLPPSPISYPAVTKFKTASSSKTGGGTSPAEMVRFRAKAMMADPSSRFRSTQNMPYSTPYTLSNAPLAARLSSPKTGVQPLSPRTKALIDIQTYEGSFKLDSGLAALLGVSISDLEAKLATCFVFNGGSNLTSLSKKQKRKIWATIFAIKLFEIQLAGESDVWGLVVDKAWAWISTVVGNEDIKALEKLVGEVLGG